MTDKVVLMVKMVLMVFLELMVCLVLMVLKEKWAPWDPKACLEQRVIPDLKENKVIPA